MRQDLQKSFVAGRVLLHARSQRFWPGRPADRINSIPLNRPAARMATGGRTSPGRLPLRGGNLMPESLAGLGVAFVKGFANCMTRTANRFVKTYR